MIYQPPLPGISVSSCVCKNLNEGMDWISHNHPAKKSITVLSSFVEDKRWNLILPGSVLAGFVQQINFQETLGGAMHELFVAFRYYPD